jgi:hypothetical protein
MRTTEWELLGRLGLALVLRDVLSRVTNAGFAVSDLNFQRHDEDAVVVDVRVTGREPDTD